jgi:hypothetical protein
LNLVNYFSSSAPQIALLISVSWAFTVTVALPSATRAMSKTPTLLMFATPLAMFTLVALAGCDLDTPLRVHARIFSAVAFLVLGAYVLVRGPGVSPTAAYKLVGMFLFSGFAISTGDLVELGVITEFLNIAIVLFLLQSLSVSRTGKLGSGIKFRSPAYALAAAITFFFTMFFVAIIFFMAFAFFIFLLNSEVSYASLDPVANFKRGGFTYFFLFILALKLAAAPIHLWKLEVFSASSYSYIFFYSSVYLFFFVFIMRAVAVKLDVSANSTGARALSVLIAVTLIFVAANVGAVLDTRHFIVVSTLLNSSILLIAIFLAAASRQDFFFIIFLNYLFSSVSIFIFLTMASGAVRFVSGLRTPVNANAAAVCLVVPLLALAGAAPSLGFLAKFMLVFNC